MRRDLVNRLREAPLLYYIFMIVMHPYVCVANNTGKCTVPILCARPQSVQGNMCACDTVSSRAAG